MDPASPPVAPKLTLRAAAKLRLGALRFTASFNQPGTGRVTAKLGGVTVKRSVSFSKAGSVTFTLKTKAAQNRRLRRALKKGKVGARVTPAAKGASASASATLLR